MKKQFITALAAVALLATLNACSKDDSPEPNKKPLTTSYNPLDPGGFGYITLPEGEFYYYEDGMTAYDEAGKNYLAGTLPLSLTKYKNGELLDSVCNKDLALYFEHKVRKTYDKENKWGYKPRVAEEITPIVTFSAGNETTIKLSKMATAFGLEVNTPFKGKEYNVTVRFRNSKTNYSLPHAYTRYLNHVRADGQPALGLPGGAYLWAYRSDIPFDEISITVGERASEPTQGAPFDISLAGFRYKLAE
jgi:hypothetical protein